MNFCPRCGTRMTRDSNSDNALACPNCGVRAPRPGKAGGEIEQPAPATRVDADRSSGGSITRDDLMRLPEVREMMRREIPYFQEAMEYAEGRYDEECRRSAEECPDNLELEPGLFYKQVYTWFVCERVRPSTGRTVLEEFVETYVATRDPAVARRMLQSRNVVRGSFRVLDNGHLPYVLVEQVETGTRYVVVTKISESKARAFFARGCVVDGKIHLWGENGCYMFNGILSKTESDEERGRRLGFITPGMLEAIKARFWEDQVANCEEMLVNRNTTLRSAMNRYPSQWVDAVCSALSIDTAVVRMKKEKAKAAASKLEHGYAEELMRKKLGERHVAALRVLLASGWVVKYGQLARRFSAEIGFSWNEHPPGSEIGVLRLHGFVVVGRMPDGGRLYKVALVPLELRAPVERFLSVAPLGAEV